MGFELDKVNFIQIDVLKEVGNIGSGNAATALSKMINKRIDMGVPEVKVLEFKDVNEMLGSAETNVVGVMLSVFGDISGFIIFILEEVDAKRLLQILMGQIGEECDDFCEIQISALKELGNILTGSYLSALSTLTSLNIVASVPQIAIDMVGAIISVPAIELGKTGESVLYIETEFNDGEDKVTGDFLLIPDVDSYDILLRALGVLD
jgi:chemotaxis protein CheC